MGKNPNAKRLKEKKHKENKEYSQDLDDLQEEAARLGCEIWELEKVRKDIEGSDEESDEETEQQEDGHEKTVKEEIK